MSALDIGIVLNVKLKLVERPNADHLLDSINVSIAKVKEDSVLHLAMDGHVNWDVLNKFDNTLVVDGLSCAQRVVHGAFQNGSNKM